MLSVADGKTEGPSVNPEVFKRPIADLKQRGLIDTQGGPGGGCWLTDAGWERAKNSNY